MKIKIANLEIVRVHRHGLESSRGLLEGPRVGAGQGKHNRGFARFVVQPQSMATYNFNN